MQSKFACLLVLGANAEFADNHAEMRRMDVPNSICKQKVVITKADISKDAEEVSWKIFMALSIWKEMMVEENTRRAGKAATSSTAVGPSVGGSGAPSRRIDVAFSIWKKVVMEAQAM